MEWIRVILRTFRVSFPLFYVRDEGIFVCLLAPIRDSFRSIFFYQVLDITYIRIYMSQVLQQFISKLHFHSFLNGLPARKERQVVTSSWKSIVAARN